MKSRSQHGSLNHPDTLALVPVSGPTWDDPSTGLHCTVDSNGIATGHATGTTPRANADTIRGCLVRASQRYDRAVRQSVTIQNYEHADTIRVEQGSRMRPGDRKRFHMWFQEWYREGERLLAEAINADEAIIAGKQFVYDQRPRLGDQWAPEYESPEFKV